MCQSEQAAGLRKPKYVESPRVPGDTISSALRKDESATVESFVRNFCQRKYSGSSLLPARIVTALVCFFPPVDQIDNRALIIEFVLQYMFLGALEKDIKCGDLRLESRVPSLLLHSRAPGPLTMAAVSFTSSEHKQERRNAAFIKRSLKHLVFYEVNPVPNESQPTLFLTHKCKPTHK
ncbi:protein TANC1 isoform X1 [Tachysurus ichikawai]